MSAARLGGEFNRVAWVLDPERNLNNDTAHGMHETAERSVLPVEGAPATDLGELLESAVAISNARSTDAIRLSLLKTLFELLPIRRFTAYRLSGPRDAPRLNELVNARLGPAADRSDLIVCGLGARGLVPGALEQQSLQALKPRQTYSSRGIIECFPVLCAGRVTELLVTDRQYEESASDQRVLYALVRLYANLLELVHDKEVDTLTGVLNRRAFAAQLDSLLEERKTPLLVGKDQTHWWLVMIDVDHFKSINDRYGHLIGDEVLLLLARLMREHFRAIDSVYRYGGEEFAVILAPSTRDAAMAAVERLRLLVEGHRFPQVGQVTISSGLVAVDHYEYPASVIGRADRALYFAKGAGRNQVFEYQALVEQGLISNDPTGNELELF